MPQGITYALLGAVVGYMTSRTKKARTSKALTYGVGAYLLATQVAPRVGVNLPNLLPRNG